MGTQRRFLLIPCPGIEGALAGFDERGNRIIWYDNNLLAGLNKSANADTPSWSILAHEIGHHLHGHMIADADAEQSRRDELAADHFSGFVLFKLRAPLEQAQNALKAFPDVYNERSSRHPKHELRMAAMAAGYNEAASEHASASTSKYSYVLRGMIQYYPCGSKTLTTHIVDKITTEPYLREFENLYGRFVNVSVEATQLTNGRPCGVPGTMRNSPHQHMHVPGLPDDINLLSVGSLGAPGPYFKGGWQGRLTGNDPLGCMRFEIGFEPSTACDGR